MIKIITPGTRKTISCDTCGCVFSYEKEDEQTDNRRYETYIACPQCKARVLLAKSGHKIQFPTFD
jgi:DNA-directed RNA polymerase subunit RPC12/RpoP